MLRPWPSLAAALARRAAVRGLAQGPRAPRAPLTPETLTAVAAKLGHQFRDARALERALTHPSSGRGASRRFERLEFLGDRVLGLVVAEWLERAFPDDDEGATQLRHADLVRARALVFVGREVLGLGGAVVHAHGGRDRGVVGDAVEALVGAVFLDGGYDAARAAVLRAWAPLLDRARDAPAPRDNAKNRLQDVAQKARKPRPTYELLRKDGPDEDPTFTVRVTYDGRAAVAAATGKAPKKRAEILAAHSLLAALGDDAEPAPD